ncbi:putative Sin3 complex subunit (Stb2) [Aspergillus lucknowensis]|uniref:STB6-like N-terminal domain-containing protein n=1 Tax=Aspergillus lucknowensis TaxID=176173 RepID=A0ABR4LZM4_9EURO
MSSTGPPVGAQAAASPTTNRETTRTSVNVLESPISSPHGLDGSTSRPGHQRIVFTDPVALRYLEEDPSTVVLHRRLALEGYEIYIVEQWACSRIHPTFVITTYTGDSSHKVVVGVLGVPTNEATWSPRLRMYFNAVKRCQLREKETPLGTVMVTDLNSFPSGLTVIPVPNGDIIRHREDFIVNENLKRLGCTGRAGLKLQAPSTATVAKFHQLYRTSERIQLYSAVIELVKQCQIALMMFGNLAPEYVDGLLCDVTEAAVGDWWTDIGMDLYNIEPSDGRLGPTTVAALLGTLMGARNRLHAFGAPVSKDVFDIPSLKRGIGAFQKSQKMKRTRQLNRHTLDRLHRTTAKAANAEGWTDAVKSTMAELSGHGGEMVMGMVRGKEKGGIADIETIDIDNFAQLATGERAKWLWRGKPRKSAVEAIGPPAADMMFTTDEQGGYVWTSRKRHSHEDLGIDPAFQRSDRSWKQQEVAGFSEDKDQNLPRMVIKGVSEKVSDARVGFGKFKDAVGISGRRSHPQKQSKDGLEIVGDATYLASPESDTEISPSKKIAENYVQPGYESAPLPETRVLDDTEQAEPPPDTALQSTEAIPPEITVEPAASNDDTDTSRKASVTRIDDESQDLDRSKTQSTDISGVSADQESKPTPASCAMVLQRAHSSDELQFGNDQNRQNDYWPRHLSFSTVEEVVLKFKRLGDDTIIEKPGATLEKAIIHEDALASDARISGSRIRDLEICTVPWVESQVSSVDKLNRALYEIHERLNSSYLERFEMYQHVREQSSDLLAGEHSRLTEQLKRVEMLGAKLDYELHALESKVEDVETGLGDFERHVDEIELRIKALVRGEDERRNCSWLSRLRRLGS